MTTPLDARCERARQLSAAGRLDEAVDELTAAVVASSPLVLRLGKQAFYDLHDLPEEEAYRRAVDVMTDNALRHDAQEGIAAFLAKRPPGWTGR